MGTWDTKKRVGAKSFTKAIFIFETLSNEDSIPVLEHLRHQGKATFSDLLEATGMDALGLHLQLENLGQTGAIQCEQNGPLRTYQLNLERLSQISATAKEINFLRMQALQNTVV